MLPERCTLPDHFGFCDFLGRLTLAFLQSKSSSFCSTRRRCLKNGDEGEVLKAIIETERMLFRPLTLADTDDLAALYADPETMRFLGGTRTREQARAQIEESLLWYKRLDCYFWATIHKADGRFIGRCGLLPQVIDGGLEAEVAYMIARPYWNRGLGAEAAHAIREYGFQRFHFSRLISIVSPDNIASKRVAQKNGMQHIKDVELNSHSFRLFTIETENDQVADPRWSGLARTLGVNTGFDAGDHAPAGLRTPWEPLLRRRKSNTFASP